MTIASSLYFQCEVVGEKEHATHLRWLSSCRVLALCDVAGLRCQRSTALLLFGGTVGQVLPAVASRSPWCSGALCVLATAGGRRGAPVPARGFLPIMSAGDP